MKKPNINWPIFQTGIMLLGLALHIASRDYIAGVAMFIFLILSIWLSFFVSMREYCFREYIKQKTSTEPAAPTV